MATLNKFNCFSQDLVNGVHNFSSHVFKAAFTNTAPVATNTQLTNITQIASGGGYTAGAGGGVQLDSVTVSQASGTTKVTIADEVFTASASVGPFRYIVLYNDTATNDPLIGYYDYGSSVTLANTETFTVDFDGTNGVFTLG